MRRSPGGAHNGYLDTYLDLGLIGKYVLSFFEILNGGDTDWVSSWQWYYVPGRKEPSQRVVISGLFSISLLWTIH